MLYLDSADPEELKVAASLGFVAGVTTNPTLMRPHADDPLGHFGRLLGVFENGPLFYQPTVAEAEGAEREARAAAGLDPGRVVIKLPANLEHLALAARLSGEGVVCALTAVYAPGQALLAREAGCRWVIPYVDRAAREGDHGLIGRLARTLRAADGDARGESRILAASVKSAGQALAAVEAGAHDVSAPMAVIGGLAEHPSSERDAANFAAAYTKLETSLTAKRHRER